MMRRLWHGLLRLLGLLRGPGRGNRVVHRFSVEGRVGWVQGVTGVVVWIKPVDEAERKERRRRFWRHVWRSIRELFGARKDHADRYPHQIFLMEVEDVDGLTVRVENNLYTGRELRSLKKGMRIEVGGEYLPNERGGKIHHTHGKRGYVWKR